MRNAKRRFAFSPWLYRQRNLVDRFFNRIKQFRGIATRYDRCPENHLFLTLDRADLSNRRRHAFLNRRRS
jgi:transposase